MTTDIFGQRRIEPPHTLATHRHAGETNPENNALQLDAGASDDIQQHAATKPEDYTISVDQVREHFSSKGVKKSKDTIQRWCRAGDLDCQKRGVLGRYFTTEASLLKLEEKILPDMIAESSGAAILQPDAAASGRIRDNVKVHAAVDEAPRSGMQVNEAGNAGACSNTQLHQADHIAVQSDFKNSMQSQHRVQLRSLPVCGLRLLV